MTTLQSGTILKTPFKAECIAFYKTVMDLKVLFEDDFLTCFECGDGYLMIEPDPEGSETSSCDHLVLRFNVENVLGELEHLRRHGIDAQYAKFDWGEIASFQDPAGTRLELKDAASFQTQIRKFRSDR